ncbi:SDR family oxidoreductase [Eilatimonas milleporae]|uniref:Peroxisomal trans-2-enoyl-CoA reductase n=1 Tax=Eilatimonas milleporae TaxID=911205 RepID=A0A3M0CX74_9PROT|nr:SDR family oxidoreductase [Eilatimonas milleporae]RMB12109.1 NAD(P)-dependent dehydrogenase (short-subunit alcohol dehydrogenase family) [Eilatimonas milleporae]
MASQAKTTPALVTPDYSGMSLENLAKTATVYRSDLLAGQTAVISGGGSGMGRAMAVLYARLGADVVICGRREEKLAEVRDAIKEYVGREISYQALTIRDADAVDDFMRDAFDRHDGIDVLINSAGGQFSQDAIDFSRKGWLAVIDTNLNGTWWMMQSAARLWRERDEPGNIINVVATVERGMPQSAHSCAARAGVIYLSKTVSTEWAPLKIRVNCIAPGAIQSEGVTQYPDEALKDFPLANPMKRFGSVWDIAQGAVYLTADTSNFVTGEVLTIDGGMSQYGWVWPIGKPDYFKD